jgi:hypothetical protein
VTAATGQDADGRACAVFASVARSPTLLPIWNCSRGRATGCPTAMNARVHGCCRISFAEFRDKYSPSNTRAGLTLMNQFILVSLAVACICLFLAYLLIKHRKTIFAILTGLVIIGVFQVYLHLSLDSSIRACIDRACTSAGLPPGCPQAEFGCSEWSGLSIFLFYIAGIVQVIIFAIGTGIMIFLASRKESGASRLSDAP